MPTRRMMCQKTGPDVDGWCANLDVKEYVMTVLNLTIEYCDEHAAQPLALGHVRKADDATTN